MFRAYNILELNFDSKLRWNEIAKWTRTLSSQWVLLEEKILYIKSKQTYLMVSFYTYLEIYLDDLNKAVSLGEFETRLKKPHQTIKQHLSKLVLEKVLIESKKGRFVFYSLNKSNPFLVEYLSVCEKERLFDFLKDTLFFRLYQQVSPFLNANKVLIFGSATESKKYQDIDILIISKDKKIISALKDFEKTYSVKLHIVQTEEKNLTESLIKEVKKKHIIFSGHTYFLRLIHKPVEYFSTY
jgi:hypothetical protein